VIAALALAATLLIRDVTIIDPATRTVTAHRDVLPRDGKIASIRSAGVSPGGDNALAPPLVERGWAPGSFTRDWTAAQYDEAQRAWPKLLALQKTLFNAGVVMTVGADMPTPWIVPGASVHDEMLLLRDAGIPPMDVLRMATSNAALALHRDSGAIGAGKRADLVLLAANPLDDLRNTRKIELVVKGGVAYDPRGLLADATARSH
jgi:imidazolonepropionase-like amidohydrolase